MISINYKSLKYIFKKIHIVFNVQKSIAMMSGTYRPIVSRLSQSQISMPQEIQSKSIKGLSFLSTPIFFKACCSVTKFPNTKRDCSSSFSVQFLSLGKAYALIWVGYVFAFFGPLFLYPH